MINFKNYIMDAKKFSRDTSNLLELKDSKFYVTSKTSGWEESCDNAYGGVDVSWAFHETEEEIEKQAVGRLYEMLIDELQLAIDEEYGLDQIQTVIDKYSNL